MKNKTATFLFLFTSSFFALKAQTPFENGYSNGYSKGYCFDGATGCVVPDITTPKPSINESESSYQDGFQKGFDNGYKKFEIRKGGSNSNLNENSTFSKGDDFSVPLSMQNNTYEVDLKQYQPKVELKDYYPEFSNFNQKTDEIIQSLKSDLQSIGESRISNIPKKNQDFNVPQNDQTNRFIQSEKDKSMVKLWLLTILSLIIIVFLLNKWRNIMWFMLDTSNFLKPYYGLFVISSLITHGWTVIIAFTVGGVWGGIFSLILPGISEIYWMIKMLGQNNVYSIIALSQIVLIIPILNIRNVR
jgi:hypothetical protein